MSKIQASFIFLSCYPIISVPVKNPSNAGGVHRDRIFDLLTSIQITTITA